MVAWKVAQTDSMKVAHNPTKDEHETILETASERDDEDVSCVVINGDEEWLKDYERMKEDITWTREEFGNKSYDKYPMTEEETPCPTIDQVVVVAENQVNDQQHRPEQHGPADEAVGDTSANEEDEN